MDQVSGKGVIGTAEAEAAAATEAKRRRAVTTENGVVLLVCF